MRREDRELRALYDARRLLLREWRCSGAEPADFERVNKAIDAIEWYQDAPAREHHERMTALMDRIEAEILKVARRWFLQALECHPRALR